MTIARLNTLLFSPFSKPCSLSLVRVGKRLPHWYVLPVTIAPRDDFLDPTTLENVQAIARSYGQFDLLPCATWWLRITLPVSRSITNNLFLEECSVISTKTMISRLVTRCLNLLYVLSASKCFSYCIVFIGAAYCLV